MKAEYLKPVAVNPITGERGSRTADYVDVEGLLIHLQAPSLGDPVWRGHPAVSHLTPQGLNALEKAEKARGGESHWVADTREELLQKLADAVETPMFEEIRHLWMSIEPNTGLFAAPYRIVRTHPWRYIVVPNDARQWTMQLDNGSCIFVVPMEIQHFRRHEEGGSGNRAGWLLIEGNNHGTEPYSRVADALEVLRGMADEKFPARTAAKESAK